MATTTKQAPKITSAQVRRLTQQLERQLSVSWVRVERRTLKLRGIERSRREARLNQQHDERILRISLRVNRVPV